MKRQRQVFVPETVPGGNGWDEGGRRGRVGWADCGAGSVHGCKRLVVVEEKEESAPIVPSGVGVSEVERDLRPRGCQ